MMEILMVVIVVVIMGGLAMPWFLGVMQSYRARVAAWELAGDLRLARQKAVSLQQSHRVCFAACANPVPTGGYILERQVGGVWQLDLSRSDLPNGVGLVSSANTVRYQTTGDAFGATITVSNSVTTYQVVASATGRVRVCRNACPP